MTLVIELDIQALGMPNDRWSGWYVEQLKTHTKRAAPRG